MNFSLVVCSAVVHTNCCAEFIASNPITVGAENSDDCLSTLRRKPGDEVRFAFSHDSHSVVGKAPREYPHQHSPMQLRSDHERSRGLGPLSHLEIDFLHCACWEWKSSVDVSRGSDEEMGHEESSLWQAGVAVSEHVHWHLRAANELSRVGIVAWLRLPNCVRDESRQCRWLSACQERAAYSIKFGSASLLYVILLHVCRWEVSFLDHGFQNSKYDHNKSKFMDLGVKQMKANYNEVRYEFPIFNSLSRIFGRTMASSSLCWSWKLFQSDSRRILLGNNTLKLHAFILLGHFSHLLDL